MTQLDRLRAAVRYSSGAARRELQRQIEDIVTQPVAEPVKEPAIAAPEPREKPGLVVAEPVAEPVAVRWCGWCGETLPLDLAGPFCGPTCEAEEAAALAAADPAPEPQACPHSDESRDPYETAPDPEPPHSAPALATPATLKEVSAPRAGLAPVHQGAGSGQAWWEADGRRERLRHLWDDEGWTATAIAIDLGTSKNAVLGAVHRGELSARREGAPKPAPSRALDAVAKGGCMWPKGDPGEPDFAFCGEPSDPGRPYCGRHVAIAYVQVPRKERSPLRGG